MDIDGWKFSWHAINRALDMAVEADELRQVLCRPSRVWSDEREPTCRYLSNRRVTLSVDIEQQTVITVLWYREPYGERRWSRDDFQAELKRIRDANAEGDDPSS